MTEYMDDKTFEFWYLPDRLRYINSSAVYHVFDLDENKPFDEIVQGVVNYGLQRFYEDLGDKEYGKLSPSQKDHLEDMLYVHATYLAKVEFYRRFGNEQDA